MVNARLTREPGPVWAVPLRRTVPALERRHDPLERRLALGVDRYLSPRRAHAFDLRTSETQALADIDNRRRERQRADEGGRSNGTGQ